MSISEGSLPTKVSAAHSTALEAELDDSLEEGRWQQAVRSSRLFGGADSKAVVQRLER